jgi:hypothetical protein
LEVLSRQAGFNVQKGTQGWSLERKAREATKQYVERWEKEGWKLESKVVLSLVPQAKDNWVPRARGNKTIWVPTGTGMRPDHPFYREGMDQYRITAWWSRAPRSADFDIPDDTYKRLVEQDRLPAGLSIKE